MSNKPNKTPKPTSSLPKSSDYKERGAKIPPQKSTPPMPPVKPPKPKN